MDEEQRSFEDDPVDEDEEEDRAVADFVSEIELNNSNVKLRRESQDEEEDAEHLDKKDEVKEEGDEASSQASIDDVTDDEDGDAVDEAACQEEREEEETEVLETQQSMHNFIRSTQSKPQIQGAKVNDGRDSQN